MSDLKLFKLAGRKAQEISGSADGLERTLQTCIEENLEPILGVRFLASEFATGKSHGGRIDTLGIDENNCPVIVEYKRAVNENVINQGLFYLDWLLDHKADFKLLVIDKLTKKAGDEIDWSSPRLICIAADFKRHDEHAVRQINRNIELVRYRRFGTDLLALELVHRNSAEEIEQKEDKPRPSTKSHDKTFNKSLKDLSPTLRDLYEALTAHIVALGDDVEEKRLKLYVAFRRIKNFACIVVSQKGLTLYLKIDPTSVQLESGFSRDVRKIGHWATGNLEIWIDSKSAFERAVPLIHRAYNNS